jgi:hypothetical protein
MSRNDKATQSLWEYAFCKGGGIHTLYTHCYIHCTHTVHTLYSYTVHTLYTHCTIVLRTMFLCVVVQLVYTHVVFLRTMSARPP